jgi:hypothetical protein
MDEWHPGAHSNCSRHLPQAVRIEITYGKGNKTYTFVDQSRRGGQWNPVSMLPFAAGWPAKIVVRNHGTGDNCASNNCVWVADAFRLTELGHRAANCEQIFRGAQPPAPVPADDSYYATPAPTHGTPPPWDPKLVQQSVRAYAAPVSLTIDDQDALMSAQGALHTLACDDTAYLGSAYTVSAGSASAKFMFRPSASGCYRLDEFHPRASDKCRLSLPVPVVVESAQGAHDTVAIDVKYGGGQWNIVGHYPLQQGILGGVKVIRESSWPVGKLWVADAFRFTRVSESCAMRPHSSLITLRIVGADIPISAATGQPAEPPGLRLAFRGAVAEAAEIGTDQVFILDLRQGSIRVDLELRGIAADIIVAVRRLESDLVSGRAGGLATALCSAAGAPVSSCHVEVERFVVDPERHDEQPPWDTIVIASISCVVGLGLCFALASWQHRRGGPVKPWGVLCFALASWRRRRGGPVKNCDDSAELRAAAAAETPSGEQLQLADRDAIWSIPVGFAEGGDGAAEWKSGGVSDEAWAPPHALEWKPQPPCGSPVACKSSRGKPLQQDFLSYARQLHAQKETERNVGDDMKAAQIITGMSNSTAPPSRESSKAPEPDAEPEANDSEPQANDFAFTRGETCCDDLALESVGSFASTESPGWL